MLKNRVDRTWHQLGVYKEGKEGIRDGSYISNLNDLGPLIKMRKTRKITNTFGAVRKNVFNFRHFDLNAYGTSKLR